MLCFFWKWVIPSSIPSFFLVHVFHFGNSLFHLITRRYYHFLLLLCLLFQFSDLCFLRRNFPSSILSIFLGFLLYLLFLCYLFFLMVGVHMFFFRLFALFSLDNPIFF